MASFQAKIGSKRPRKKESNNYRFIQIGRASCRERVFALV